MTGTTISTCGASHGANSRYVNVGNNFRNLMRVTDDERRQEGLVFHSIKNTFFLDVCCVTLEQIKMGETAVVFR